MKIINLKKFIRSIILFLTTIIIITLLFAKSSLSYKNLEYKTLYVSSGDTLWKIAELESKINSCYANKDIRDIISNLKRVNNLENNNIIEGQKLLIPIL